MIVFQPRYLPILAAIGLMVLSGCQGGLKPAMPNVSMPNFLSRGNQPTNLAQSPKPPTPEVTAQNYAQVQLAMGDSLAKEGKFDAAQAAYQAAIRNDDKLARAHHRLALMCERTGKGGDASEHFQRAMKLDPKNAEIVCDYGYYCYLRQDLTAAEQHFARALQLDPNLKRAHNNLGLVYARSNHPDDALTHFASAGLSPADARANLGFVYLTEKRFPQAKAELQLAAAATPSSAKAQAILARFDKIETSAQSPANRPAATQPAVASAPAANPSIHDVFEAAEAPAPTTAETRPLVAEATKPAPAVHAAKTPSPSNEIQRLAAEIPRVAQAQAPRPVPVASQPPVEAPATSPNSDRNLPTQQLAPVLSDYQF